MIKFRVDTRTGVAPYLQLVQQVRHAVRLGMLSEGDQLPTVKEIAAQVLPGGVFTLAEAAVLRGLYLLRSGHAPGRARSDAPVRRSDPSSAGNAGVEEDIEPARLSLRRNRPRVSLGFVRADQPELTTLEQS